jgi:hypothetical protein
VAELVDRAGIFVGETAEAWSDMQYAVMRDSARLAFAQAEMTRVMQRVIDSRPTSSHARERTKKHSRRS